VKAWCEQALQLGGILAFLIKRKTDQAKTFFTNKETIVTNRKEGISAGLCE
jgi:hypothetical protein